MKPAATVLIHVTHLIKLGLSALCGSITRGLLSEAASGDWSGMAEVRRPLGTCSPDRGPGGRRAVCNEQVLAGLPSFCFCTAVLAWLPSRLIFYTQPEESHRIAFCSVPFPDESVIVGNWSLGSVPYTADIVIRCPTISALAWSRPFCHLNDYVLRNFVCFDSAVLRT